MQWSYRLTRIAGIDVRIHITFLFFLAWIALNSFLVGGADAAVLSVFFMVALFGCVLLHEFGHAVAARIYGIHTPDITLFPIGGVARLDHMPEHPWQEFVVAIAGPAVNVVIAAVLIFILGQQAEYDGLNYISDPRVGLLAKLASVNISLVLFNLIPAFPMDGGRVLRALLALRMNYVRATQIAARIGQALAVVFGIVGLFGNPMLIFIAFFIYQGAQQEAAVVQMRGLSHHSRPIWRGT
jgi:Zn-dependent protease